MVVKRRKNNNVKVKAPWYVIMLRVFGGIAATPIVGFIVIMIFWGIGNALDKKTNLERAVMNYDYEMAEEILNNGANPNVYDENGNILYNKIEYNEYENEDVLANFSKVNEKEPKSKNEKTKNCDDDMVNIFMTMKKKSLLSPRRFLVDEIPWEEASVYVRRLKYM